MPTEAANLDDLYDAAGYKYNVDPLRIKAHAVQETGERADVPSADGKSDGFGQFKPETWARVMPGVPLAARRDPETAIEAMAKFIAANDDAHRDAGGRVDLAASTAAYNGSGPAADAYARAVQGVYGRLAAGGGLKLSGPAADKAGSPGADDAFAQTLKGSPKSLVEGGAAEGGAPDAFAATLKGGAAASPVPPPAVTPVLDDYGRPVDADNLPDTTAAGKAIGRIGTAAADTFNNTPNMLMTPQFRQQIEAAGPVGNYITSPLLQIGGTLLRGGAALAAATTQAVNEGTEAAGVPSLARDINPLLLSAGIVAGGGGGPLTRNGLVSREMAAPTSDLPAIAQRATDRIAAPLSDEFRDNPLRPDAGGLPTPPASIPSAVGADITTAAIPEKTPAQRIADLEKSVLQTAADRAGPQMTDTTPYVEGIPPRRLAASEFHPLNALDEKIAIAADPMFRKEVETNDLARNNGMVDLLKNDAQDGIALDKAHEDRSLVDPVSLKVFDDEKPVDASPLVAKIQKYLSGPEGKQGAVRSTLNNVLESLHNADGELETMPSMIYGARKNLTDLLKKGVKGTGDMADDVRASKHVLNALLPDFDETISAGAEKFSSEYLPKYHEASIPINQMEFLQKYQTGAKKITDINGNLLPNKVQTMLDDILQGVKAPGVNAAKTLSDEQINHIIAVRNELAAGVLRDRQAAVKGSDSFQQINRAITPIKSGKRIAVENTLGMGAHGAMALSPAAGWGNALLGAYQGVVKPALRANKEAKAARDAADAIAARKAQLLSSPNALRQD